MAALPEVTGTACSWNATRESTPTIYSLTPALNSSTRANTASADTAIYLGCLFPIGKHVEINPYYEHQNQTGPSPNQQYNQLGSIVNLYFARRSQMDFIVVGEVPLGGVPPQRYRFEISNSFLVRL